MTQKEIAISFLNLVGLGEVQKGFEDHTAPDFFHHNQYFEGGGEALKQAMEEAHKTDPNKSVEIKYSYEDGDTVITHTEVIKQHMQIAVVHIFRFENNKIVELWDLGQQIEKESPNKNGLF